MSKDKNNSASNNSSDRKKALDVAISHIEKTYGKGSIMQMSGDAVQSSVEVISSGSLGLDIALGIGGYPKGRIIEIYGPESSGKTTLALHAVAECQKAGGTAAFIDAEHALDTSYASKLGCKIDELFISQPDTGEQALEITDQLIRSGGVDIVVIDSVAALTPRSEIEGEMGDSHMGLHARLMSQALRKITSSVSRTNTLLVFINQTRLKIGVIYGNPETTTGGIALKFYASQRIEVRPTGARLTSDGKEDPVGRKTKVKVVKNKMAPPFRQVEFDIIFGEGISKHGELIDLGVECDTVERAGSWFSYNGERLGQGRDRVKKFLAENPKIADEIESKIRSKSGVLSEVMLHGTTDKAADPDIDNDAGIT